MFWNIGLNFSYNPFVPSMFGFGMPFCMPSFNFFMPVTPYYNNTSANLIPEFNYNQPSPNNYAASNPYFSNNWFSYGNVDTFTRTTDVAQSVQPQTIPSENVVSYSAPEPVLSNKPVSNPTLSVSKNSDGSLNIEGYNAEAGKKLADIALKNAGDFHNHCAGHVEMDIAEANLGKISNADAYQMFGTLNSNPNFKPLETTDVDVNKLPAGCIPVYDKGVAGYSSDYGHIEIALGDGRAVSDGITNNMRQNPTAIYAPVYV